MTLKFVVLSDLHLVGHGKTSMTLDTAERFERAVDCINNRYGDADFCIIAGDLADEAEPEAYHRLKAISARIAVPTYITLGNHDDRQTFLSIFGQGLADQTGNVQHVIDAKGYRIIVLDSSEPGKVHGVLSPEQLALLRGQLAEAQDKPVIVVLHHNANALHIASDDIKILDDAPFIAALKTHSDIRQVIAGHVHLTSTGIYHGIPFTTLAGGHYSVSFTADQPKAEFNCMTGPGQMAVVLGTPHSTTVLFEDFIDGNARIVEFSP